MHAGLTTSARTAGRGRRWRRVRSHWGPFRGGPWASSRLRTTTRPARRPPPSTPRARHPCRSRRPRWLPPATSGHDFHVVHPASVKDVDLRSDTVTAHAGDAPRGRGRGGRRRLRRGPTVNRLGGPPADRQGGRPVRPFGHLANQCPAHARPFGRRVSSPSVRTSSRRGGRGGPCSRARSTPAGLARLAPLLPEDVAPRLRPEGDALSGPPWSGRTGHERRHRVPLEVLAAAPAPRSPST